MEVVRERGVGVPYASFRATQLLQGGVGVGEEIFQDDDFELGVAGHGFGERAPG